MTKEAQAKELIGLSRQQRRRIWVKNRKVLGMSWSEFEDNLKLTTKKDDK